MRYLLDTDVLTLFFRGQAKTVARIRDSEMHATDSIATTIVTRVQILLGRMDSLLKAADPGELERAQSNLYRSEENLKAWKVVAFSPNALTRFESLRRIKSLRRIGRADLLIACIALAENATLVTRNVKDFRPVPGLKIENWAD